MLRRLGQGQEGGMGRGRLPMVGVAMKGGLGEIGQEEGWRAEETAVQGQLAGEGRWRVQQGGQEEELLLGLSSHYR